MTERAAVIVAAGLGSRLGDVAKALLQTGDPPRTFLSRILATAREVGLADAIVVVGPPHGDRIAPHARELGCRVVVNPTPERGMASSVALGFAALDDSACTAAWLWPVDHPYVTAATLRALIDALGEHSAARPVFQQVRGGHPPLIARGLWPALSACADVEGGARTVLAAVDRIDVPVDDPGVVRDIDTPSDLELP